MHHLYKNARLDSYDWTLFETLMTVLNHKSFLLTHMKTRNRKSNDEMLKVLINLDLKLNHIYQLKSIDAVKIKELETALLQKLSD